MFEGQETEFCKNSGPETFKVSDPFSFKENGAVGERRVNT